MYPFDVDPLKVTWRNGTDEPFRDITESFKIVNNVVLLTEIPSQFNHVQVSGYSETTSPTPSSTSYRVDYAQGVVYFNESENGKTVKVKYKGKGIIQFPGNRVYVHDENNPSVTQTIQELSDVSHLMVEATANLNGIKADFMLKSTYDNDGNGTVDNSDKVGGQTLANLDNRYASMTDFEFLAIIPKRIAGETTDSPAIRRALDKILANGRGTLFFPEREYIINEPIIIYSNVRYQGRAKMATTIKLADGANCDIFKTDHFEELSTLHNGGAYPSNYYSILPQGFYIFDLNVDGNYLDYDSNGNLVADGIYYKHNNTTGYGLKIYGRNYEIDRIRLNNIPEVGAYFECKDSETGKLALQCTISGYEGLVYRGSPDATLDRINIGKSGYHAKKFDGTIDSTLNQSVLYPGNAIDGVVIDKTCEIGELHSWSCDTGFAFRAKSGYRIKARQLMAEGSLNGAYLDDSRFQIGIMDLHNNRGVSLQTAGDSGKQISNLEVIWDKNPSDYGLTGWGNTLVINGNNHNIKGVIRLGSNCTGDAITLTGSNNNIDMTIRSYTQSNVFVYGGGLRNFVKLITENCKNVVKLNTNVSIGNKFNITSQTSPGQTLLNVGAYSMNTLTSSWDVIWQQVDANGALIATKTSNERIAVGNVINLDSTAVQNINVSHNFFITPEAYNISLDTTAFASLTDYAIGILKSTIITSDTITVQVKLTTASATAGAKATILMKID